MMPVCEEQLRRVPARQARARCDTLFFVSRVLPHMAACCRRFPPSPLIFYSPLAAALDSSPALSFSIAHVGPCLPLCTPRCGRGLEGRRWPGSVARRPTTSTYACSLLNASGCCCRVEALPAFWLSDEMWVLNESSRRCRSKIKLTVVLASMVGVSHCTGMGGLV